MAKGDSVEVHVRSAVGFIPYRMTASQNGRMVDIEFERESGVSWVVVRERTRGGTVVAKDRYALDNVLLIREARRSDEA